MVGTNLANAASLLPSVQHSGANTFVTGGIGLDESVAFKIAMKDWPLSLQFAEKDGQRAHYVADVQVVDHRLPIERLRLQGTQGTVGE